MSTDCRAGLCNLWTALGSSAARTGWNLSDFLFQGPNAKRWSDKIEANRRRDRRNTQACKGAGWTVIRVWECEVRSDAEQAALRIAVACGRRTG